GRTRTMLVQPIAVCLQAESTGPLANAWETNEVTEALAVAAGCPEPGNPGCRCPSCRTAAEDEAAYVVADDAPVLLGSTGWLPLPGDSLAGDVACVVYTP